MSTEHTAPQPPPGPGSDPDRGGAPGMSAPYLPPASPAVAQVRPARPPIEPVQISSSEQQEGSEQTLFVIDGVEYKVRVPVSPVIGLRYMEQLRQHGGSEEGQAMAAAHLLPDLVGRDGWDALLAYDQLTAEQWQSVMRIAGQLMSESMGGGDSARFTGGR